MCPREARPGRALQVKVEILLCFLRPVGYHWLWVGRVRPALQFKRLLAGARGADRRTRQWRLDIPGGGNGGRECGGIGWSEDDLVECSRGYADGAGGASDLRVRGHGSSQVSGVLVKSATGLAWLCGICP